MTFRLGTFSRAAAARFAGPVVGERVVPLGGQSVLDILSSWDSTFASLAEAAARTDGIDVRELRVHAPIDVPRQIFCTIANYRSHIAEVVGDPERAAQAIEERLRTPPYVCFKLPTTVIGPDDPLVLPSVAQKIDWELE